MRAVAIVVLALVAAPIIGQGCGGPKDCSQNSDCPSGQVCLFPPGDCAAQGQCKDNHKSGCSPNCNDSNGVICGCDGGLVASGCGDNGWTTGPTPKETSSACFELPTTQEAGGEIDGAEAGSSDGALASADGPDGGDSGAD
jgi:Cys-rich repeat protein